MTLEEKFIYFSNMLQGTVSCFEHRKTEYFLSEALSEGFSIHDFKKPCMLALKKNYLKCAESFLAKQMLQNDIDYSESMETSEYHFLNEMTKEGNLEAIKLLVAYGADLENPSFLGDIPIFIAAKKYRLDIVDYFIDKGVDINIKSPIHGSLLHVFSMAGEAHGVTYLLNKGVDISVNVNALDKDGLTPLFWASNKNHHDVIKLLLDHGADIDYSLDMALARKNKTTAYTLIKYADENNLTFKNHESVYSRLLLIEASHGKLAAIENLIAKMADIETQDEHGRTPFLIAIQQNHIPLLDLMIEAGADINHEDNNGNNALYYALKSKNCSLALFQYLIEKGVAPKMTFYAKDKEKSLLSMAKNPLIHAYLSSLEENLLLDTAIKSDETEKTISF